LRDDIEEFHCQIFDTVTGSDGHERARDAELERPPVGWEATGAESANSLQLLSP
jgi:hypothetical protein